MQLFVGKTSVYKVLETDKSLHDQNMLKEKVVYSDKYVILNVSSSQCN